MLLESKLVYLPAQPEIDADLGEFGTLSTKTRAAIGEAAAEVGSIDFGQNGDDDLGVATDAADAIANILHWVAQHDGEPELVLANARMNYQAEIRA